VLHYFELWVEVVACSCCLVCLNFLGGLFSCGCYLIVDLLSLELGDDLPENSVDALPEISDACFKAAVGVDDVDQRCVGDLYLLVRLVVFSEAILLLELWNQIVFSNLNFFNRQVCWNINYFNSIKKWSKHISC
jgi:hypothetical protein